MIPVLINNPLFRGITPEKLSANLEEISFHTRSYKKGEILARQGDVCNRLVILTKGSVRGEMIDYSGRLIKVEDIAAPRAIAPLFLFGEENRYPVEVTANKCSGIVPQERAVSRKLYEPFCQLRTDFIRQALFHVFQDYQAEDCVLFASPI